MKGILACLGLSRSAFGEVYVALDTASHDLVAIKKVKMVMNEGEIPSESQLLKEFKSKFIVRYYDVIRNENELWVGVVRNR